MTMTSYALCAGVDTEMRKQARELTTEADSQHVVKVPTGYLLQADDVGVLHGDQLRQRLGVLQAGARKKNPS
jgi:hypothetical protein